MKLFSCFCWRFLGIIFLGAISGGCASINPNHVRSPYCNQLNSQIIFNAATSNTRQAEIEGAQQPLQQRSYDDNCVLH